MRGDSRNRPFPLKYRHSCDHGSPYDNEQLPLICGQIGTTLLHAPVWDGAAKAKYERNFRTMKERLLYGLDLDKIHSLDLFRGILKDYIRSYNTRYHSGIRGSPLNAT